MKAVMTTAMQVQQAQKLSNNNLAQKQGSGQRKQALQLHYKHTSMRNDENEQPQHMVEFPWISATVDKPPVSKPLTPPHEVSFCDEVEKDLLEGEDEWMTRRAFRYQKYEPSGIYRLKTQGNKYCRSGRMVGEVENFPHATFRSRMNLKIINEGVFGTRCEANNGPYSGGVFRPAHKGHAHWREKFKKRFPLSFLKASQMNYEACA